MRCKLLFSLLVLAFLMGCQNSNTSDPSGAEPAESPVPVSESKPDPVPTAADSPLKNTLRWSTASEVDVFGFDILRADSEEGPFVSISPDPLPGHGTSDEPHAYVFVDDTIEAGRGYWYWVEEITLDGARHKLTENAFYAKPKGVAESEVSEGESP